MKAERINSITFTSVTSKQAFKSFNDSFTILKPDSFQKNLKEEKQNLKVKIGVISTAVISTLGVLYTLSKGKGKNPLKNLNIFKHEISPMDMLKITGLSVPASLAAGCILDKKENRRSKIKEGISQMVGNLIIPICLVDQSVKLKDKIDSKKFINPIMKTLKGTHKAFYTSAALVGGLIIGNRVSNVINSSIFEEHKTRPLKIQDFSAHFDDVCFAASLIFQNNKFGKYASRLIPLTLLVSAYETGTKTKNEV